MTEVSLRRLRGVLSVAVAAALLLLSPGLAGYQALAAVSEGSAPRPEEPSRSVPRPMPAATPILGLGHSNVPADQSPGIARPVGAPSAPQAEPSPLAPLAPVLPIGPEAAREGPLSAGSANSVEPAPSLSWYQSLFQRLLHKNLDPIAQGLILRRDAGGVVAQVEAFRRSGALRRAAWVLGDRDPHAVLWRAARRANEDPQALLNGFRALGGAKEATSLGEPNPDVVFGPTGWDARERRYRLTVEGPPRTNGIRPTFVYYRNSTVLTEKNGDIHGEFGDHHFLLVNDARELEDPSALKEVGLAPVAELIHKGVVDAALVVHDDRVTMALRQPGHSTFMSRGLLMSSYRGGGPDSFYEPAAQRALASLWTAAVRNFMPRPELLPGAASGRSRSALRTAIMVAAGSALYVGAVLLLSNFLGRGLLANVIGMGLVTVVPGIAIAALHKSAAEIWWRSLGWGSLLLGGGVFLGLLPPAFWDMSLIVIIAISLTKLAFPKRFSDSANPAPAKARRLAVSDEEVRGAAAGVASGRNDSLEIPDWDPHKAAHHNGSGLRQRGATDAQMELFFQLCGQKPFPILDYRPKTDSTSA